MMKHKYDLECLKQLIKIFYDIPDKYKEWGIYKAEVREE